MEKKKKGRQNWRHSMTASASVASYVARSPSTDSLSSIGVRAQLKHDNDSFPEFDTATTTTTSSQQHPADSTPTPTTTLAVTGQEDNITTTTATTPTSSANSSRLPTPYPKVMHSRHKYRSVPTRHLDVQKMREKLQKIEERVRRNDMEDKGEKEEEEPITPAESPVRVTYLTEAPSVTTDSTPSTPTTTHTTSHHLPHLPATPATVIKAPLTDQQPRRPARTRAPLQYGPTRLSILLRVFYYLYQLFWGASLHFSARVFIVFSLSLYTLFTLWRFQEIDRESSCGTVKT